MKKRYLLFLISILLLIGLIYFSNPQEIYSVLVEAKLNYILLGLVFWLVGCLVRTYRWKYLLSKRNIEIGFFSAVKIYIMGLFISNITPLKTGDPARIYLLKEIKQKSFSRSMPSIFIERILDILCLISISILGLVFLSFSSDISYYLFFSIILYSLVIFMVLFFSLSEGKMEFFLKKIIDIFSFLPRVKKLDKKIDYFSKNFRNSLREYNKNTLLISFIISVFVWILNALVGLSVFYSIGINISYSVVLVVMSVGILIGILTILPGSLGSGEIITVFLYSQFVNVQVSSLTSVALLSRLLNFWIYVFIGLFLFLRYGVKKSENYI